MTAPVVDVRPLEEHVEAMVTAGSLLHLSCAYAAAAAEGCAGATVADLLCGSPESPVLMTVEQLFAHLRRDLRRAHEARHGGFVVPASLEDGGHGPALAGPR